jgi:predicted permease
MGDKGPPPRGFDLANIRRDPDADIDAELDFHVHCLVEDLTAGGMSEAEAREEAARRLGDRARHVLEMRSIDRSLAFRDRVVEGAVSMTRSMRHVLRGFARAPGFALGAILTLSLGIGANATTFGVVDRLLLSAPDHLDDPDRLQRILVERRIRIGEEPRVFTGSTITYPDYEDFTSATTLEAVAVTAERRIPFGRGADAFEVTAEFATASFFQLTGVRPERGRHFGTDDDRVGAEGVVVVSHSFWERQFGGVEDILGRELEIGSGRYTVVGVAPPGFTGVSVNRIDVWLPFHSAIQELVDDGRWMRSRSSYFVHAYARLAPSVDVTAAAAELTALHRRGRSSDPAQSEYDSEARILLRPIQAAFGPDVSSAEVGVAHWLSGVSAIVLLIACANVASLLLARGTRRRREIAVRLALGVSRPRLVLELMLEGFVLAALGGLAAVVIALWGAPWVRDAILPGIEWSTPAGNHRLWSFIVIASLLTALLAGLIPAIQSTRPDIAGALKSGARSSRGRTRTGTILLVAQAGLSVVLLVGAGLFVRSLLQVQSLDLGFDADEIAVVMLDFGSFEGGPLDRARIYDRARERLGALSGVDGVAYSTSVPFMSSWSTTFHLPGRDTRPRPEGGGPYYYSVTPDFLEIMGLQLVQGRNLSSTDTEAADRVAVVNQTLADLMWPSEDALGQCMLIGSQDAPCTTVVGIAEDSRRQTLIEGEEALYYMPFAQFHEEPPAALFVRTAREGPSPAALERTLTDLDPAVRFVGARPYRDMIDPQARAWALGATMFTVFGLLALVVASVGFYSVLAFDVAQRRGEIGIRGALGARRGQLIRLVLEDGIQIAGVGLALGVAAALLAGRYAEPLLFRVSPRDPVTYVVVVSLLLVVAACASLIPATRAAHVDPNEVLRAD